MKIKISIIVPVYKVEKYIDRCIKSILEQTYSEFELILVDDGSPDNSGKICDEYAKKDNRIKVIHKKNGGLGDARNAGINIATGDYLGFIDSDDYIENDMYEKLLEACVNNNVDIAMCGRYDIQDDNITKRFAFKGDYKIWDNREAIKRLLTWDNMDSSACDKLFKKNLFDDIRFPKGKLNEDIFIMTEIIDNANKVVHIGESKYYYYHRPNSITTNDFYEGNMDAVYAANKVLEYVESRYPYYKKDAEFFYNTIVMYTFNRINSYKLKRENQRCFKILKDIILKNKSEIIFERRIKLKDKLVTASRIIGVIYIMKSIKNFLKNINIKKSKNLQGLS